MKLFDTAFLAYALLSLPDCGTKPTPAPTPPIEEPAFRKPTATEVFNLRSKCVELGEKINSGYDKADMFTAKEGMPLRWQEHFSHYNPKTNRCYVELRVIPHLFVLMAPNKKYLDEFEKHYEIDYTERFLYDGQTGEELAFLQRGLKNHAPILQRRKS